MRLRPLCHVLGILLLAGCGHETTDPSAQGSELAGRWVSVVVENAGDPDHHLSVVDDRQLSRVVGIADPARVPGHSTVRVRLFVPDDVPWMISSNELLLVSAGEFEGFCGALPIKIHVAWGAGYVELPVWMGEFPWVASRPPPNCEASDRDIQRVPGAP